MRYRGIGDVRGAETSRIESVDDIRIEDQRGDRGTLPAGEADFRGVGGEGGLIRQEDWGGVT